MVVFGTVSTGGAFGVSPESKEGYKCWLKITVTMTGISSAHQPTGGPAPPLSKTTNLKLHSGTIKSECVCKRGMDNGATEWVWDGPNASPPFGGQFDYEWSIYYGPKCGGKPCIDIANPPDWDEEEMDDIVRNCPCVGGCGPFSFSIDKDLKSGSSRNAMRKTLAKEAKIQMNAAAKKQPCIKNEDCEGSGG